MKTISFFADRLHIVPEWNATCVGIAHVNIFKFELMKLASA